MFRQLDDPLLSFAQIAVKWNNKLLKERQVAMANLAATQAECSKTSSELIDLLVSFAKNAEGQDAGACKAREIDNMESLIRVLNTPTYVEGIIYLHGKVIPIISLRNKFV